MPELMPPAEIGAWDDPYELIVPLDTPNGRYRLVAGMYDWRSEAERSASSTAGGDAHGDPACGHESPE